MGQGDNGGFPALFDNDDLDRLRAEQLEREYPRVEPYRPLPIVAAQYPRIAEAIRQLWGTPEADAFFNRMLIDERGNRAGFPPEVVRALLALSELHQQAFRYRKPEDIWIDDPAVGRYSGR